MLPKSLLPGKNCRGEPRSPAEKRSFSDFPKENNRIFALRRWILLWQNPRATEGRPYGYFFDKLKGAVQMDSSLFCRACGITHADPAG